MADTIDWRRIREGDKKAFDRLFDYYYLPLCGFISPYIKNKQDVEDIVIDCFVKVWEERDKLNIKVSLRNYLLTIVRNLSVDFLRKNKLQTLEAERFLSSVPDEAQDFTNELEKQKKLYEAIGKLPEKRRLIIKMAAFEDKTYVEIAQELQLSVNTVKTQMVRAYKFLRAELEENQHPDLFLLLI